MDVYWAGRWVLQQALFRGPDDADRETLRRMMLDIADDNWTNFVTEDGEQAYGADYHPDAPLRVGSEQDIDQKLTALQILDVRQPYRRHDHDSRPEDYPVTVSTIALAERVDTSRRMLEAGSITIGEFLLETAQWQYELQTLAAEVVKQAAISQLAREQNT